jgi:hypothetical protein
MTLTTASAAALTIGLASPALALATTAGGLGAVQNQTGFGAHQSVLHTGTHHVLALPKGDDDDDDDGDDDGGGGGDAEIGGSHRSHHSRGLCGVGGHIGGLAHGCGEENGDDDDDDEGHGGGDHASEDSSACCEHGGHVKVSHAAPAPRRHYVPMGAVRSGFGGTQGMNAPLGLAGLSLLVGGAGLLPLARRRLQASARS